MALHPFSVLHYCPPVNLGHLSSKILLLQDLGLHFILSPFTLRAWASYEPLELSKLSLLVRIPLSFPLTTSLFLKIGGVAQCLVEQFFICRVAQEIVSAGRDTRVRCHRRRLCSRASSIAPDGHNTRTRGHDICIGDHTIGTRDLVTCIRKRTFNNRNRDIRSRISYNHIPTFR